MSMSYVTLLSQAFPDLRPLGADDLKGPCLRMWPFCFKSLDETARNTAIHAIVKRHLKLGRMLKLPVDRQFLQYVKLFE